eukprot:TRINITY_DN4138_c0_g1_i1.p2 TRINITY_DN4138_c0_g1~~TRINITY_DN4138_c0_g1_i1.p2  ORF type:complete len:275 (-),score=69.18 TRINITY_DN4138_c0_g1_i1:165-989(-)
MKANAVLNVLLEYVERRMEVLNSEEACEEYSDFILKLFEEKIVMAHKTNCIQYFLLYLFSQDKMEAFREKFLSLLFLKAFDDSAAIGLRLRCLNYLGSFLASTKSLSTEILLSALQMIEKKVEVKNLKLRSHVIQSLLYIINYKWPSIEVTINTSGILKKITNNTSLLYVEESILLETALLLQKLDVMKYAEEILTLEKAIAEQRKGKMHPAKAHFLFGGSVMLSVVEQKMKGEMEVYTYRQSVVMKEKSGSIDTTNSASVESLVMTKEHRKQD